MPSGTCQQTFPWALSTAPRTTTHEKTNPPAQLLPQTRHHFAVNGFPHAGTLQHHMQRSKSGNLSRSLTVQANARATMPTGQTDFPAEETVVHNLEG
jgi:hypothetical protein